MGCGFTLNFSEYFQTIHFRQFQIKKYDFRPADGFAFISSSAEEVIQCLFTIPGNMDPVSKIAPLKNVKDQLDIVGIVFHEEYLCTGRARVHV